jgi:hypothetical protein
VVLGDVLVGDVLVGDVLVGDVVVDLLPRVQDGAFLVG